MRRSQWKIGRITKLMKSGDGETRVAEVKLANGISIRRATKLLYPLETVEAADLEFKSIAVAIDNSETQTRSTGRPTNENQTSAVRLHRGMLRKSP